jgi:DNA-binding XRE family transcriptional regulator
MTELIKLKELRELKGFSTSDMAAVIGVTAGSYRLKERGLRKFEPAEIAAICAVLETTFEQIFLHQIETKRHKTVTKRN